MYGTLQLENLDTQTRGENRPPWHGYARLENPATAAEAMRQAGLDWRVRKIPLQAISSDGAAFVPDHYAVVRTDRWGEPDCPILGVVGKHYTPLQNADAFEFFDSIVGPLHMATYHAAGAADQGKRVWIVAKLSGRIEVTPSDILEKYVLLYTGHDGRASVQVLLTPIRIVCQNTLTLAVAAGQAIAYASHTRSLGRQLNCARENIQAVLQGFNDMETAFRAMAKHKMNAQKVQSYVEHVFPFRLDGPDDEIPTRIDHDRNNCIRLFDEGAGNNDPTVKGTLWAAYNAVTEHVDHWRTGMTAGHMNNVCFGPGQKIKATAFKQAIQMLGHLKGTAS